MPFSSVSLHTGPDHHPSAGSWKALSPLALELLTFLLAISFQLFPLAPPDCGFWHNSWIIFLSHYTSPGDLVHLMTINCINVQMTPGICPVAWPPHICLLPSAGLRVGCLVGVPNPERPKGITDLLCLKRPPTLSPL